MSDLMEVNGLDQSLSVDDTEILIRIETIIQESIERKDAFYALDFGKEFIKISQLSGIALAKLFYRLRENWDLFEVEDEFDSVAYAYVGMHKSTIDKYIRVWEMYEHKIIPEDLESEIRQKNIKDQIYIATLPAQGHEPTLEEWQEIADAPDYNSVASVVREIKGQKPRKSALLIFINSDGTLMAQQEDEMQFVGYLNVDDAGDIAEKAIQRLLRAAGVLER